MTSSNPLPDEVREQAVIAIDTIDGWGDGTSPTSDEIIDAIAPILLAYQAKVDAEICQRIQDDPEFMDSGSGVVAAKIVIRAQFPAVPTDTEADHG